MEASIMTEACAKVRATSWYGKPEGFWGQVSSFIMSYSCESQLESCESNINPFQGCTSSDLTAFRKPLPFKLPTSSHHGHTENQDHSTGNCPYTAHGSVPVIIQATFSLESTQSPTRSQPSFLSRVLKQMSERQYSSHFEKQMKEKDLTNTTSGI